MTKPPVPEKEPGFIRYIMAANATGTGSILAFLAAAAIFFPLGWYQCNQNYKNKGAKIVNQAISHDTIDQEVVKRLEDREARLSQSLQYLGYNEDDIDELLHGKPKTLDTIKDKFTKVIRGKTKTIYLPREDCADDYLGELASDQANKIIIDGFNNRYKPDEE